MPPRIFRTLLSIALPALPLACGGCSVYRDTVNPSFPITARQAGDEVRRMRADPAPLARPVVVIGGYRSPDPIVESLAIELSRLTSGDRADFVRTSMWFEADIPDAAARVVEAVNAAYPPTDPGATVEVDVVAKSMGGLVARYAADRLARERPGSPKLTINRLFTLATPHRGALMAERSPLVEDRAVADMYRRSLLITMLDEAYGGDYEIVPYTRLRDGVVGAINTAPPGRSPIWVSSPVVGGSHLTVNEDERILVDIARRLRGETPLGVEGEALPESERARPAR